MVQFFPFLLSPPSSDRRQRGHPRLRNADCTVLYNAKVSFTLLRAWHCWRITQKTDFREETERQCLCKTNEREKEEKEQDGLSESEKKRGNARVTARLASISDTFGHRRH